MLRFIGICLFHPGLGNPDTSRLRSYNDLPFRDAVSNSIKNGTGSYISLHQTSNSNCSKICIEFIKS